MHPDNAEEYRSVRDFFDTTLLCFLFIPASVMAGLSRKRVSGGLRSESAPSLP